MGEIRIIAGLWRGRFLRVRTGGRGEGPRPTTDRVRTSLFDRLNPILPGARVLDLFAGSGALGVEALSRGAARATFVEKSAATVRLLEANLQALGADGVDIRFEDAFRAIGHLERAEARFDLILADPPYASGEAPRIVTRLDDSPLLTTGGLLVIEHDRRELLPPAGGRLEPADERRYGDTLLSFYHGR